MADRSLRALQERICKINYEQELSSRVARLRQELAEAEAQFLEVSTGRSDHESLTTQGATDSEDSDDELLSPVWDASDGCFRCAACAGETIEGECQFCGEIHAMRDTGTAQDIYDADVDDWTFAPLSTDRLPTKRSETPLLPGFDDVLAPTTFLGGDDAYRTLLCRGATPAMIDEFRLDWDPATGIIATATEDLYEAWAGPAIRRGDSVWKVALGRRLTLGQYDIDGYEFVAELLDDCLHPSGIMATYWETVQERRGVWVTRPKNPRQSQQTAKLDFDGPIAYHDDYEDDSETEDVGWYEANRSGLAEDGPSTDSPHGKDQVPVSDEEGATYGPMPTGEEAADDDAMDCDSATTDSDQPGSDWDSQEELSGDEEAMRFDFRKIRVLDHAFPQPGPL